MVEDADVEERERVSEATRDQFVRLAGLVDARWMIGGISTSGVIEPCHIHS